MEKEAGLNERMMFKEKEQTLNTDNTSRITMENAGTRLGEVEDSNGVKGGKAGEENKVDEQAGAK